MSLPTNLLAALAAEPPPPVVPGDGSNPMAVILFQIVAFMAIFYFLLIRPQKKERQRHQEMLGTLTRGDHVMTNGGILGQIVHATDTELTIKTAENTRIAIDRGHVARKLTDD